MVPTNVTSTDNATNASIDYEFRLSNVYMDNLDTALRIIGLLIHVFYLIIVLLVKELQKRSLIYIHQVNLYGFLFMFQYVCYISSNVPTFPDPWTNDALCTLSEITWATTKYFRSYSILMLAVYRLVAVVKIEWFKKWIKSIKIIVASFVIEFTICVPFILLSKYSFMTTYGPVMCYDGYSTNLSLGIRYFALTTVLGVIIPNVLVIFIYVYTVKVLKKLEKKLRKDRKKNQGKSLTVMSFKRIFKNQIQQVLDQSRTETTSFSTATSTAFKTSAFRETQQARLTRQFLVISVCLILSSMTFTFLNITNLLPQFDTIWYYYRLGVRIATLASQSIVPIVSLYGHPKLVELYQGFMSFEWYRNPNKIHPK